MKRLIKLLKKLKFIWNKPKSNLISISQLNKIIDNKNNFYFALMNENWYLPDIKDKCCTFEYLWNIFTNKIFRIKRV